MYRLSAIILLGNGLFNARDHEAALSVREAELSMKRRLGASEENLLPVQHNLANTYQVIGRLEQALRMRQDVYSGRLKLNGEHLFTITAAICYASTLKDLNRYDEAKSLLCKYIPVARRVLGESNELTLQMRWGYAEALYRDDGATLDEICEAVTTLEDVERIARRVLGGGHPTTEGIEESLRYARTALVRKTIS